MKFLFSAIFLLLLANCASPQTRALSSPNEVRFDMSLLLSWNDAKKDKSTAEREVLYKFNKNGKILFYLAASHTNDKNSKTFSAIKWVFDNTKPDIAIVEGVPNSKGISPQPVFTNMTEDIKGDFYPHGERA